MLGDPPPLLPRLDGAAAVAWRHLPGEGELSHTLRLLAALRFEWRDLGLAPDEAALALDEIRRVSGQVAAALTAAQPPEDRLLVATLGAAAANSLTYAPPRRAVWITLGRQLELGASGRLGAWRSATMRVHGAVQVHGILSAASSDETRVAPAVVVGVEVRPPAFATATWQPSLLVRGGAVLSTHDRLGLDACPAGTRDPAACTRPLLQAGLALSLLESARLQILGEWYPRRGRHPALWSVSPMLGMQAQF
jgi:hypothetical protein